MEAYAGDILEHALNKGITSSANRYGVPVEQVRGLVKAFAKEVDPAYYGPCACERAGGMCFMCEKQTMQPRVRVE